MTNKEFEELNVKIARKLGWTRFRKERTPEPLATRRMVGLAPGNFRRQFVPHYATNLAYALQIVDWTNEHGHNFSLKRHTDNKDFEAMFANSKRLALGKSDLPSLAICLAFLNI